MRRSERGQVLVLFAVFLVVAALMLSLSYFLYSAKRQRGAAEEIARAAVRAGCLEVDEDRFGRGLVRLNEERARSRVLQALQQGLRHLPYGLSSGATPESVANAAEIQVVNAAPDEPRISPFTGLTYTRPFVAVRLVVPTASFFVPIELTVVQEDEIVVGVEP